MLSQSACREQALPWVSLGVHTFVVEMQRPLMHSASVSHRLPSAPDWQVLGASLEKQCASVLHAASSSLAQSSAHSRVLSLQAYSPGQTASEVQHTLLTLQHMPLEQDPLLQSLGFVHAERSPSLLAQVRLRLSQRPLLHSESASQGLPLRSL